MPMSEADFRLLLHDAQRSAADELAEKSVHTPPWTDGQRLEALLRAFARIAHGARALAQAHKREASILRQKLDFYEPNPNVAHNGGPLREDPREDAGCTHRWRDGSGRCRDCE